MKANQKKPNLHNEGGESRNWTSYNFQTLRDDIFFLAKDGAVTKNRIAPARSACAVLVSSQNQNREWIYSQQQTVSSGGFSGTAFSTYVPHTVRTKETMGCTDCHVAEGGENNAWMATLLMQGTGLRELHRPLRLRGRGAPRVRGGGGDRARRAPGGDRLAPARAGLPEGVRGPQGPGRRRSRRPTTTAATWSPCSCGASTSSPPRARAACASTTWPRSTTRASRERMVSAPVSPLGQKLYVKTKDATSVALPTTMTIDAGAQGRAREPRAAGPPHLRLRLRDRPRGGPRGGGPAARRSWTATRPTTS